MDNTMKDDRVLDDDDMDSQMIEPEELGTVEPKEAGHEWLTDAQRGGIGTSKPKVKVAKVDGPPTWVIRKFEKLARVEGLTYYEYVDKYNPSFDPTEWDNDPA